MNATGGDPSFLRRFNAAAVLRALHPQMGDELAGDAGLTVSQIASAVNVSRPTAEEAVDALHQRGWVEVLAPQTGDRRGAGRPARRFRFRPDAGFVVGVDVEAASVSVAVADLTGAVIGHERRPAPSALGAADRLTAIHETIRAALTIAGVSPDRVLGGTVGSTGVVDREGRVVRNSLPEWTGLRLSEEVGSMIDAPVTAYNHLRLGALGERWRGAAQNADDVLHLHAGQRMGLGVVIGGTPLIGAHGASGEFTPTIADGWMGAYAALLEHPLAVVRVDPAMLLDRTVGLGGVMGDAGPVFDAAATGDASARQAVQAFAQAIAAQMAPIIAAFDPEILIIGGDLARAGETVLEPVRQTLGASCPFPPEVRVSQLGDDSITLGAIRSALDDVESRLFDDPQNLGLD